jgi:hypothetical protein
MPRHPMFEKVIAAPTLSDQVAQALLARIEFARQGVRAPSAQAGEPVAPSLNRHHHRLFVASPQDAPCNSLSPGFLADSAPLFPNG